ncbi:protein SRG1-like isoform X1 [Cucurbita moschata]|uniref:Protein SRG1-like isoform X1 n=1 Tax=Cucurbita moschata TaxID=3662 RepID=A0A6J1H9T6_CUCMO|nr:protein SRG1-like isoform X1 [Cucurbita moschata]
MISVLQPEQQNSVASAPPAMAGTNPSGTVQDVASKGEVPERYIHKESDRGARDAPLMAAPVIDMALLSSSSESGPELEKLRHGLQSWGCFQVVNHGMSAEFLDEIRRLAKQFFDLPMEEKSKYSREEDEIEGYGNDMILSNQQILDWTDRLYLTVYPKESHRFKYWPTNPERFRAVLHEYTANVKLLSEKILKAMAISLDLNEDSFIKQYGEEVKLDARFNFYPRCRNPDLVLGVKPHADGSAITILLQDEEVEGLQFLNGNEWFNAPIVPGALLINVGDQAEITSNGIFKSPVHRVLTNSERERISLAVFYLPDWEKEIEPLEKLIDETRPRLYKTVKNFVGLYFQYYQQGQRPMEAARI